MPKVSSKGHQQLKRIQRVGPQVIAEEGLVRDGVGIDPEMLRDKAPYLLSDGHVLLRQGPAPHVRLIPPATRGVPDRLRGKET